MREIVKSIGTVLPEIPKPEKKPGLNERFVWTGLALIAYLVMATTPLYGLSGPGREQDQLAFLRVVFASTQGSLMELGIGPIVTSGLILQLLVGSEIIKLKMSDPADRAIFGSATKFLTLIVIVGESFAYIFGGALGPQAGSALCLAQNNVNCLSVTQDWVIFIQLFIASVLVLLLDELIQKGWGIGSGVSLFILAGVCQTILWYTFSPIAVNVGGGKLEFFGFVPQLISSAFTNTFSDIVVRGFQYPSLLTFTFTVVMLLAIVYIEGIRVELPITSVKYRGFQGVYPIKLLYVSNIPVILVSALGANVTFFARILYNYEGTNPPWWLKLLGTWPSNTTSSQQPTGGIVYYMTPPQGVDQTISRLQAWDFQPVIYLVYLLVLAVMFARLWVEIGGLNPKAVAKNLISANVQVPGFRRTGLSIEQVLNRYIPTLTIIGGILIGLVAGISDLFGVFGSGIGILLMCDIILQYYQSLLKEQVEEVSPALAGLIGAA